MRVTCTQPSLSIPHLGVHFVDGVAEVDGEQLAQLGSYRVHGVVLPGDEPAPEEADVDVQPNDEPDPEPEVKPKTARGKAAVKPFG